MKEIYDDQIVDMVCSKRFKQFVVWCKSWPKALKYFADLIEELETGEVINPDIVHKKIIELKIAAELKKKNITRDQVHNFFHDYQSWSNEQGLPVPHDLTKLRITKIRNILRNYSDQDISKVFDKASRSTFIRKSNFFNLDWITKIGNFLKVLEGNYDDKDGLSRSLV